MNAEDAAMNEDADNPDLSAELRELIDSMQPSAEFADRVQLSLRDHALVSPRRRKRPRLIGALAAIGVVAVFTVALVAGFGLRTHQQSMPNQARLGQGPAAAVGSGARDKFVWLTSPIPLSTPVAGTGFKTAGYHVYVIDWTGAVRYEFDRPYTVGNSRAMIQVISADGRRALLDNGTVIDQTGSTVAAVPALANAGFVRNGSHWTEDDTAVCQAVSNQPAPPTSTFPPQGTTAPLPPPTPYAAPGADHSVTLNVIGTDGAARSVATVGSEALGEPSGNVPDTTSVLSCSRAADVAVIARYHDATDASAERSATEMRVSLWAIRLSTGQVLFHQGETQMALGRTFFFGSQNAALAVEFLWNSATPGSEIDRVLRIPSGATVPIADSGVIPGTGADTPGLSADGTRILRRLIDVHAQTTVLELLDANTGEVVQHFELKGIQGATAVAYPDGSSFMVDIAGQLFLMDSNGDTTQLHPSVTLSGPFAAQLPMPPGTQG